MSKLEVLDKYWNRFEDTYQEIAICDGAMNSEYYRSDQFSITEENYIEARTRIKEEITKGLQAGQAADLSNHEPSSLALMQQMQVPKVEIPKFSGQRRDWEGFRDLYISLVHDIRGDAIVARKSHR